MVHAMLIVSNYGYEGEDTYPVYVLNPRALGLNKGEYVRIYFIDPTNHTAYETTFQLNTLGDIALKAKGTFYAPDDPSKTFGTVRIDYSTDGSTFNSIALATLFCFKCKKVVKLVVGESTRLGRKIYALKGSEESTVKPTQSSSEIIVNVYALAPSYVAISRSVTVKIPPDRYIPVIAYSCRGTECRVLVPLIEDTYEWKPKFFIEVILVEDSDIKGYYFADMETFEKDAETGAIYVEKVLYRSTFRIEFAPEDKEFIKALLVGKVNIVEEGDNYLVVEVVHGTGVPIIPILVIVALGIICATLVTVSRISYQKEKEVTKQKEIEYKYAYDVGKLQLEYAKTVTTTLPPEKATEVLLKTSPQSAIAKPMKEDLDKTSSELETFKSIVMWLVIGGIAIAVLYFLRGMFGR